MKTILRILGSCAFIYGVFGFFQFNFNPANWHWAIQLAAGVVSLSVCGALAMFGWVDAVTKTDEP